MQAIPKEKYQIFRYDPKKDLLRLTRDIQNKKIDVVFPVLHGKYGEDGKIQGFLEMLHIPYVGADVLGSALSMDKIVTKYLFKAIDIPTPAFWIINQGQRIRSLPLPCVVKPSDAGSSVGVTIVKKRKDLVPAIRKAFQESPRVLVEKYVHGTELTVGILGTSRPKVLPIIEIIPQQDGFYSYRAKYAQGGSKHICPARLPSSLTRRIQKTALKIYTTLNLKSMARIDFMYQKKSKKFYCLEINTIPGMTDTSLLPEAAKQAGLPFSQLLDLLIKTAFEK